MEEYRFEHKEPLTQRVVLALRVNTKQLKEHLWLGTEYEVGTALRSLDKPLYPPAGGVLVRVREKLRRGLDRSCLGPL